MGIDIYTFINKLVDSYYYSKIVIHYKGNEFITHEDSYQDDIEKYDLKRGTVNDFDIEHSHTGIHILVIFLG